VKNLSDYLDPVFEKLKNPIRGIETGIFMLDEMLLGLKPSELIVVAGRPSMGKTSLMTDFVLSASRKGLVIVFSAEMSFQILAERVVANLANLNLHSLKKGGITEKATIDINRALGYLKRKKIYIDDTNYMTPLLIKNKIERELIPDDVSCVFIDYLQLLGADMSTGRSYEDMGAITRDIKALAKELNIPIVLLCQLNRANTKRESYEPRLSDLRDSGKIEENADVVLLIHRPSYYSIKELDIESKDDGESWIIVAKNRNGPVGRIPVVWLSEFMSFREIKPETF